MEKYSITQFLADYPTDDVCLEELFQARYANLPYCMKCGVVDPKYYRVKKRKSYACKDCGYQVFPLAHTIYHGSTTPLRLWFYAIYLMSTSKNGVAAAELQRQLGVTYKCAWRMATQIRLLMEQDREKLSGVVEADETYYGGRRRSTNRFKNKTPIIGAVERGGKAKVFVASDHFSSKSAMLFVELNVAKGSTLNTDESRLYLRAKNDYDHKSVCHSRYEFVNEKIHTNSVEGFWGQFKRSLAGTHHAVSKKYLQSYVDEYVFRYNHRSQPVFPLLLGEAARKVRSTS